MLANTHYLILFSLFLLNLIPIKTIQPPASCEFHKSAIDELNVKQGFLTLWEDSGINLPLNQRSEQGGWVVSNGHGDFQVIPFPDEWHTAPCEIILPADYLDSLPSGLVGVVHTHPFHEGENTTASDVCGSDTTQHYISGPNYNDLKFLVEIANHLSDFCIQGYVIDGDYVVAMTSWGGEAFHPAESFFRGIRPDI